MVNCSFCTKDIPRGTGKVYVKKDGRVLQFCSNKCEKNMVKLNRKPVKFKWTRPQETTPKKTTKKTTTTVEPKVEEAKK